MDAAELAIALRTLAASRPRESSSYNEPLQEETPRDKLARMMKQPDIVEEAPPGLLERAGSTAASGLSAAGNLLDLPGSMVRDVATWLPGGPKPANPIDQVFSPFSHQNRTTGRDLLRGYGLAGKKDSWGNFAAGLGAEIALDPLTYLTFGGSALTRGGQAARAAGLSNRARDVAAKSLGRQVGAREARHVVTPRMLLDDIADPVARQQKTEQLRRLGLRDADFDRQLGGMAKIGLPFSDKPFRFGGKPFTFWGLTDESGVIGAGKLKIPPQGKAGSSTPSVPPPSPPPAPAPAPLTFTAPAGVARPVAPPTAPPAAANQAQAQAAVQTPLSVAPKTPVVSKVQSTKKPLENPVAMVSNQDQLPDELLDPGVASPVAKTKGPSYYDQAVQLANEKGKVSPRDIASSLNIPDKVAMEVHRSMFENKIITRNGQLIPEMADDLVAVDDVAKAAPAAPAVEVPPVAKAPDPTPVEPVVPATPGTKQEVLFAKTPAEEFMQSLPEPKQNILKAIQQESFDPQILRSAKPDEVYEILDNAIEAGVLDKKAGKALKDKLPESLDAAYPELSGSMWKGKDELIYGKPSRGMASAKIRQDKDGVSVVVDSFFRSQRAPAGSGKMLLRSLVNEAQSVNPRRIIMNFDSPRGVNTFDSVAKEIEGDAHRFVNKETGKPATLKEVLDNPKGFYGVKEFPAKAATAAKIEAPTMATQPAKQVDDFDAALEEAKSLKPKLSKEARQIDLKYKQIGGENYDIVQGLLSRDPVSSIRGLVAARGVPLTRIIPLFDEIVQAKAIPEEAVERITHALGGPKPKSALEKLDAVAKSSEDELEFLNRLKGTDLPIQQGTPEFVKLMAKRMKVLNQLPEEVQETLTISAPFGSVDQFKDVDELFLKELGDQHGGVLQSRGQAVEGVVPGAVKTMRFGDLKDMPEEFRPAVEDFVAKAGSTLFEDIGLRLGKMAPEEQAMAQIDFNNRMVDVFANSVASGRVTNDTIHEMWHHLSRYFSDDEVKGIQKEFGRAKEVFKRDNGDIELPYHLSSIDEYVAHTMTEMSLKYLGKPKPEGFLQTSWGKMVEVFEKLWDSALKIFGVGQTRRILRDFLAGNRAMDTMKTQGSMANRLGATDGGVLKSTVAPSVPPSAPPPAALPLTPEQIADQLSGFRSAKIGKGLDTIGQGIADSAVGRQMSALFDQSVLGRVSKRGQEVGRRAFGDYKQAVEDMRKRIAPYIPTWTRTLTAVNEESIIANELRPLSEYVRMHGAKAKEIQMRDARLIRNVRTNDLLRLVELPYYGSNGKRLDLTIQPNQIPAWIKGNENRQQVADMLTFFREENARMATDENLAGVMLSIRNRYFPRILSALPGVTDLPWNPNYGKLLDASHPHQRARHDYMDGWDDGTAVINDISIDGEISGLHAGKNVKEALKNNDVKPIAMRLWKKYGNRLDAAEAGKQFDELPDSLQRRLMDLTESMMRLDTKHVQHNIPLFSSNMIDAMMDRLEHSYRSMSHAGALADLASGSITTKSLISAGGKGSTLRTALSDSKWMNPVAARRTLEEISRKSPEVVHESDKAFWLTHVQPKIQDIVDDLASGVVPRSLQRTQNGESYFVFADEFPPDMGLNLPGAQIQIRYNPTAGTMGVDIGDLDRLSGGVAWRPVPNPIGMTADQYAGMRPIAPAQWHLDNMVVDADTAAEMAAFVKGPRMLSELRGPVRAADQFLSTWKMMQTGMMPFLGFHGRNFGSGQSNNLFTGIQADPRFQFQANDPSTWLNPIRSFVEPIRDAHRMATGGVIPGISQAPMFAGRGLTDEQATELLRQTSFGHGITGERQGLAAEQLQESQQSLKSQYPGSPGSPNPFAGKWSDPVPESTWSQRWLQPWMMKGGLASQDIFRPGQLGKDLAGYTENLNRLSPLIAMTRQGYDPKVMADLINRSQVDYTMMSNFERDYMRRWLPFYAYTRRMTPTVVETLAERPGGAMGRTVMATTRAGQTEEQGVTPDYIRETASIPLGVSEDGTRSYITGFGFPFEDALQFASLLKGDAQSVLRELGSRLNPIPKTVIESATGRSLYQSGPFGGREIEDLDPTIGRIIANVHDLATGEKTEQARPIFDSAWAEYAISNSGLGRTLNTIRTATDPRKWDIPPWKLALNLGTGVRIADVSPAAQDAIFRERLARIMKDLGGRMYTRPYFPDYAESRWSDTQAKEAAQIAEVMKMLNQRAVARRKAQELAAQ